MRPPARWRGSATLPGAVAAPPYWDTGWLVLSLEGGELAAFRASDGELLWRAPLGAVAHVAPAPALDNLYLGLADGRTVAAGAGVGARRVEPDPRRACHGPHGARRPAARRHAMSALHSLDLRRGTVRWRFRTGAPVVARPTADEQRIYVVAYDHILRALDRRSGNLRWRRALPHRPAGRRPCSWAQWCWCRRWPPSWRRTTRARAHPALAIASTSEVAGSTHFRVGGSASGTRLLAVSVEGKLLAFAPRVEPAPVPLAQPARRGGRGAAAASAAAGAGASAGRHPVEPQVRDQRGEAEELEDEAAHHPRAHLQRQRGKANEGHEGDEAQRRRRQHRRGGAERHQRRDDSEDDADFDRAGGRRTSSRAAWRRRPSQSSTAMAICVSR